MRTEGIPIDSSIYDTVLNGLYFAMNAFLFAVSCALFLHGAYCLDEDLDEIQREEDRLPYYLKDDGIRRVAKLNKDHFNKTLKASRMLVVLFYFSSNENNEVEYSWKADEKMLEVSKLHTQANGNTQLGRITSVEVTVASGQTADYMDILALFIFHMKLIILFALV